MIHVYHVWYASSMMRIMHQTWIIAVYDAWIMYGAWIIAVYDAWIMYGAWIIAAYDAWILDRIMTTIPPSLLSPPLYLRTFLQGVSTIPPLMRFLTSPSFLQSWRKEWVLLICLDLKLKYQNNVWCSFIICANVFLLFNGPLLLFTTDHLSCFTAVSIVLAAGTEIQANLQVNIFILLPFLAFTVGAPWVQFWLPPIKWG